MNKIVVDIVIPAYNEEQVLPYTFKRLDKLQKDLIKINVEPFFIFVNDGSKDNSYKLLNSFVKKHKGQTAVIHFTANFGHQSALKAGYDYAIKRNKAKYVISIDADLQDPPELITKMIKKAERQSLDIVYAQRRIRREQKSKVFTADAFYWLINQISSKKLPTEVADFRLVKMNILQAGVKNAKKPIFWRGVFSRLTDNVGFVKYNRKTREHGQTKYSLAKMLKLAIAGVLTMGDKIPVIMGYWAIANIFIFVLEHLGEFSSFWLFIFNFLFWSYIFLTLLLLIWYGFGIMEKDKIIYVVKEVVE